jgi:hypothetical protein
MNSYREQTVPSHVPMNGQRYYAKIMKFLVLALTGTIIGMAVTVAISYYVS